MKSSTVFSVRDLSQAGECRRFAAYTAKDELEFNETEVGKLSIIVTELATNLVKHGNGGELIFRSLHEGESQGIEILALDKGPGMSNVGECLRDGYSTAGSPGTGLGAIQRLSSLFEIHSVPKLGTAIMVRLWSKGHSSHSIKQNSPKFELGVVSTPIHGEQVCGDSWEVAVAPGGNALRSLFIVADGLGHGVSAHEAGEEAVKTFLKYAAGSPAEIVKECHASLRKTRGAALAVAEVNLESGKIYYSGIGNITGIVIPLEGKAQRLVSHNGTAGGELYRVQEFNYEWKPRALLVMHSDGINTRWDLDHYPGILAKHPALIAGILYRDFRRNTDDTTVLVAKENW